MSFALEIQDPYKYEKELQKDIKKMLLWHPKVAWCKINTTGKVQGRNGHWMTLGEAGESDIIGMLKDGRFFVIEVKLPGEEPTEDQWKFLNMVINNGGVSGWADNLEDAVKIITEN